MCFLKKALGKILDAQSIFKSLMKKAIEICMMIGDC
jgi:hypothetical protein